MIIRRAQMRDTAGILGLLCQVQNVHAEGRPDLFKRGGIKYREPDLQQIIRDDARPVYVAVDGDDRVLGYVFCIFEMQEENSSLQAVSTLYIDDLCVDEDLRGQKIGQQLYVHTLDVAREKGCDRVTLHVWECNPGARKFYEKMGLVPVTTTMEKRISNE